MSAKRTCGSCGGSGNASCGPNHGLECCRKHDCCSCELGYGETRSDCLVCAGSGTVDAKASREDAIADAETFRAHTARLMGGGHGWCAMQHGMMAERRLHQNKTDEAIRFVLAGARAAFRAVPGLRG